MTESREERVLVFASYNSFRGQRGTVTQRKPYLMVLLDGERSPMRFNEREIVPLREGEHVAGAE